MGVVIALIKFFLQMWSVCPFICVCVSLSLSQYIYIFLDRDEENIESNI